MTTELTYLVWTAILCLALWLPYIGAGAAQFGFLTVADYREPPQRDLPSWVERAHRAHLNLLENLPSFATLVLIAHVTDSNTSVTAVAAAAFFWARVVQTAVHYLGTPYVRTLAFSVGWVAQLAIAWQILS